LPEGKLEQLQKIAERRGVPFEWANLMDGCRRSETRTSPSTRANLVSYQKAPIRYYAPPATKNFQNMITGAANAEPPSADDATKAFRTISDTLSSHLLAFADPVLVNKMDLQNTLRNDSRISTRYRAFLQTIGVQPKLFILSPPSTATICFAEQNMPW